MAGCGQLLWSGFPRRAQRLLSSIEKCQGFTVLGVEAEDILGVSMDDRPIAFGERLIRLIEKAFYATLNSVASRAETF